MAEETIVCPYATRCVVASRKSAQVDADPILKENDPPISYRCKYASGGCFVTEQLNLLERISRGAEMRRG